MGRHYVHFVESFRTIGALPHAVRNAVLYAIVAEEMAASLQDRILEVLSTDGAKCKSLHGLVISLESMDGNIL
jgi:hypothetical protein